MADAIEANLGKSRRNCRRTRAIAGRQPYGDGGTRDRRLYRAGAGQHAGEGEGGGVRVAAMREEIKAGGHSSPYRLRKQLPEPVLGQIKQARGFRQFSWRRREGRQRVGPRLPRPQYLEPPRGGPRPWPAHLATG